jgi:tetratricopeptide (TPR) repeat protein
MRRRLFDDQQPDVASSLTALALLRVAQGQYPEALQLAQSAKAIDTAALSADHWRTAIAESAEGAALMGLNRYSDAEARLTHSCVILGKESGAPRVYRVLAERYLTALHQQGRRVGGASSGATLSARSSKTQVASIAK